MLSRLRSRRPRLGDERGFTLIELLLASTIGLVILGSATMITVGAARHNGDVANRADATQRGRLAVDRMERTLRSQVCTTLASFPITSAKADSVTFFADLSGGSQPVVRHTFTFSPTAKTITDAAETGSTGTPLTFGAAKTTTLATDVVRDGTQALFRYYGYPATAPASGNLEPNIELVPAAGASLSATDLGRVARIDLNFLTTGATYSTQKIKADMTDEVFVRLADPNDATSSFNPSCA